MENVAAEQAELAQAELRAGTVQAIDYPAPADRKALASEDYAVVGYTPPKGSRSGIGSLLLGVHDDEGRLVYAGHVGTGFSDRVLADLRRRIEAGEWDHGEALPPIQIFGRTRNVAHMLRTVASEPLRSDDYPRRVRERRDRAGPAAGDGNQRLPRHR